MKSFVESEATAAIRIEVEPPHFGSRIPGSDDPWPDVPVVIEAGDDDIVSGFPRGAESPAHREGERCHVLTESDLVGGGAEEIADRAAGRRCHGVGLTRGHERPTVVAPPGSHEVGHRIDDRLRYLGTTRPIQICSRSPADHAGQRWEL